MSTSPNAIEISGLGMKYGRAWAVRGLDLNVPKGCVYGLLGLNGAGKSSTMRALYGLQEPHEGRILVQGHDPARNPVAVKRCVGFVPDRPAFYDWMRVEETLALVARHRRDRWDVAFADRLLRTFRLDPTARMGALSKGQAAKVALLTAMAFNPDLLLLDEPTGGLDPVVRREFLESILAEYVEEGRTVLISSHLITEISGIVDRVGILSDGRMMVDESADALSARVKAARLTFSGEAPARVDVPGTIGTHRKGREVRLVFDRFDADSTPQALAQLGAESLYIEDLPLESIFVELVKDRIAPREEEVA